MNWPRIAGFCVLALITISTNVEAPSSASEKRRAAEFWEPTMRYQYSRAELYYVNWDTPLCQHA